MKKFGFTLAEVLITLTIIGVVAAVTLPALQANVQEQAAISRYKKTMNTLNNVGATVDAVNRFNYSDCEFSEKSNNTRGIDPATRNLRRHIWAVLDEYAKLDRVASQNIQPNDIGGACSAAMDGSRGIGVVIFKDGTAFCWAPAFHNRVGNAPRSYYGIIDVNGVRPPNTISTCGDANCSRNKRINDQFRVTLNSTNALPGWAMFDTNWQTPNNFLTSSANMAAIWAFNR